MSEQCRRRLRAPGRWQGYGWASGKQAGSTSGRAGEAKPSARGGSDRPRAMSRGPALVVGGRWRDRRRRLADGARDSPTLS